MRVLNWDSGEFRELDVDALLQAVTASAAEAAYLDGDGLVPQEVGEVHAGSKFVIPLLIPEGVESGDGRKMKEGALSTRDLPIPLLWQPSTGDGHQGSYIVGRIDAIDRVDGGLGNARGVFDTGPYGREAERLVRERMLRGVSADLDQFEANVDPEESDELDDQSKITNERMVVSKARVMAATLVSKPAFQECYIELVSEEPMEDMTPINDGIYEETPAIEDAADAALAALAASAAPIHPPRSWFENPGLEKATPLTIGEDGRVYGHIASWETDHIAYNYGVRPPRSRSNYAYFRTGLCRTEEGEDVAVGQLTLAGGHAPLDADAHMAVKHYDDTASAVADVAAGEDAYGIWVAGALRPNVTPEQVRALRASAPSGDWRPINNSLELVAVCQVNVPGFPIARARVASGSVMALVAAGASTLAKLRHSQIEELKTRVDAIEQRELAARKAQIAKNFEAVREERRKKLELAAQEARERLAPELSRRAQAMAEMAARAEEARRRMTEFKLSVAPNFDEAKHPRDDHGRFREVLAKLTDILSSPDAGDVPGAREARASLERAVNAEDNGDMEGARQAGEQAKAALDRAVNDQGTAPEVKDDLQEVAADAEQATSGAGAADANAPSPGQDEQPVLDADQAPATDVAPETTPAADEAKPEAAPKTDAPAPAKPDAKKGDDAALLDAPQPLIDLIETMIDEFGENVDPRRIIGAMDSRMKAWLEGRGFKSPEDMARVVGQIVQHKVQPDIGQ